MINKEEESKKTWQNIRRRGSLYTFDKTVPAICPCGICDNYPWVELCSTCNPYKNTTKKSQKSSISLNHVSHANL